MFLVVNNVILVKAGITIYIDVLFSFQVILYIDKPFWTRTSRSVFGAFWPEMVHVNHITTVAIRMCDVRATQGLLNRVCVYALGYFTTLSHLHRLNGVFWMLWLVLLSQHLLENTYVNSV
jgi:hypothetical protein